MTQVHVSRILILIFCLPTHFVSVYLPLSRSSHNMYAFAGWVVVQGLIRTPVACLRLLVPKPIVFDYIYIEMSEASQRCYCRIEQYLIAQHKMSTGLIFRCFACPQIAHYIAALFCISNQPSCTVRSILYTLFLILNSDYRYLQLIYATTYIII